jgi:hypothetical protein
MSGLFGIKTILGIHAGVALTGLLLVAIWFLTGLLVRISFVNAMSRAMERNLSRFLPGYATYKEMAEEKLQHKIKILPYTSALIKWQEYWLIDYQSSELINEELPKFRTPDESRLTIYHGDLAIDMYTPSNHHLVWRGVARKTLDPKAKPDKRQENLNKAVAKLMRNYPPPK